MHDRSGVDRLIADLTRPEAFPSPPERVETLQTHASVIFFAGERVYKVKKPVDFGFLNFSTLQRRRFFCEEEIRLNRRLAPDAYLGVRTIVEDDEGRLRIANEDDRGPVVDYAVEMRRLPADQMLAKLLERADVADNDIARLVDVLVEFHDRAEAGGDVPEFGRPGAVRRRVGVNLSETEKFAGELPDDAQPGAPAISRRLLLALQAWTSAWIDRNEGLIAARAEQGRIREGHGDLHAGNICVLPDRIVIYDCIEFERSFRCADVASDLAFLGMDLDRRGHPRLARDVIDRYARQSGDPDVPALQPLYRVHYACVRGKVDALRSREQEVDPDERIDAWRSAAAYFALAAGYIAPPALVLMCGAPGSGKSWLAEPLAAALRADWLRSDVKRKELLGLGPTERAGEDAYTADTTDRTYTALREDTRAALEQRRSTIVDATFAQRDRRAPFLSLAAELGAPLLVIHLDPPEQTIRERLRSRPGDPAEVSDADERVFESGRSRFDRPDEVDPKSLITLTKPRAREIDVLAALERLVDLR